MVQEWATALAWAEAACGHDVAAVRPLLGGTTGEMLALTDGSGAGSVLRLVTREPWRTHGGPLTTRESEVQRMLADTAIPAPRSLALDAHGERCGHPAHLMTLLPGAIDPDRTDPVSLGRLADLLATIHDVTPTIPVRSYQSWAWEAKYVVPDWATDPGLWEQAFALLRTEPPAYDACFIHRDFALRNVLWLGEEITGIVDWVETSMGPAWLDVAHCCTNIAIRQGSATADAFADAYRARTGREPQPHFEVMDIVGFLSAPGRAAFTDDPRQLCLLERRLRSVMARL